MPKKQREPIMSPEDERYVAFEGLVQWTRAVIAQSERVATAKNKLRWSSEVRTNSYIRRETVHSAHYEDHFFVIAVCKLIEHREWVEQLGLCATIDFSEIDGFLEGGKLNKSKVKDLRNMREHIVDYQKGDGIAQDRWVEEIPGHKVDAGTFVGNNIGGRLDCIQFTEAAKRLLPQLLAEPML